MKLFVFFIKTICFLCLLIFISSFSHITSRKVSNNISHLNIIKKDTILPDTVFVDSVFTSYKPYKENVHASYYHDKFNGKNTASGEKFNNNLYTAAHRTLKFGTKIKVTNVVNNEFVIVTVNDRGPFVKGREIDLSKKAFMEIAKHKIAGFLIVHLEILEE